MARAVLFFIVHQEGILTFKISLGIREVTEALTCERRHTTSFSDTRYVGRIPTYQAQWQWCWLWRQTHWFQQTLARICTWSHLGSKPSLRPVKRESAKDDSKGFPRDSCCSRKWLHVRCWKSWQLFKSRSRENWLRMPEYAFVCFWLSTNGFTQHKSHGQVFFRQKVWKWQWQAQAQTFTCTGLFASCALRMAQEAAQTLDVYTWCLFWLHFLRCTTWEETTQGDLSSPAAAISLDFCSWMSNEFRRLGFTLYSDLLGTTGCMCGRPSCFVSSLEKRDWKGIGSAQNEEQSGSQSYPAQMSLPSSG